MLQTFPYHMSSCAPLCSKHALRKLYLDCSITVSNTSVNVLLGHQHVVTVQLEYFDL